MIQYKLENYFIGSHACDNGRCIAAYNIRHVVGMEYCSKFLNEHRVTDNSTDVLRSLMLFA